MEHEFPECWKTRRIHDPLHLSILMCWIHPSRLFSQLPSFVPSDFFCLAHKPPSTAGLVLPSALRFLRSPYDMPHYATSTLTPDDKRRIISALPPSTSHIFAMARGQIYHAPFTATSSSEWKPLDLRGAIVFGRDTREYEIRDDASSRKSSLGSLGSAGTSGTSGSSGLMGSAGAMSDEPGSMPVMGEADEAGDLAGGLRVRPDDELWFRLIEVDPHQKKPAKVVWRQPVQPANSDYKMLVPFFHAFSGNVSRSLVDVAGQRTDYWSCRVGCLGSGSRTTTRRISFTRPLWFARKRDVSLPLISSAPTPSHHTPLLCGVRRFPALVKPSAGPRSWSKSVRRRTTMSFAPVINQITDPEPGSFQHKAHVGIDEKGNIVAEGEVERKWTDFLNGPVRPKVSSLNSNLSRSDRG